MTRFFPSLKSVVGAVVLGGQVFLTSAVAQDARLDPLFDTLATTDAEGAPRIVEKIVIEWSKSGSPAMDYLLKRGRDAIESDDYSAAIQHFGALTDHTPDFAEGWHGLAIAYFNLDRIGPAMDALERTLALEPRHFQAMEGVMVILIDAGRYDAAIQVVDLIASIHPHHPDLSTFQNRLAEQTRGRDV
ncbi:MAG: tetratricopeptide repeat protein [Pseudomonadota bacterium]